MATARQLEQPGISLYEQDFFAWMTEQAAALRRNQPEGVDWENVCRDAMIQNIWLRSSRPVCIAT